MSFENLQDFFSSKSMKMKNDLFNPVIQQYDLLILTNDNHQQEISKLKNKNKIIMCDFQKDNYIACLDNKIIIIKKSDDAIINYFISYFNYSTIYYTSNECKKILEDICSDISINFSQENQDDFISDELPNFLKEFIPVNVNRKDWNIISKCLSGYLIKKAYMQSNFNRIKIDKKNANEDKIDLNQTQNFIKLRQISTTSSSIISLIYFIVEEKLMISKILHKQLTPIEKDKLASREISNYQKLNHPFIPKFYGFNEKKTIFIEFIQGETLGKYDFSKLSEHEIMNIILEIFITIHYFHINKFIYRDLKPNNIMIDKNGAAVIIDFDRLFDCNLYDIEESSKDFGTDYVSPEFNNGFSYSYSHDIYSIGLVIKNIFLDKKSNRNLISSQILSHIKIMCDCCTDSNVNNRPTISQLIRFFYNNILIKMNQKTIIESRLVEILAQNLSNETLIDPFGLCTLGIIYMEGFYITDNMDLAQYFFFRSSDQKDILAQFNLWFLLISNDIKLSIDYLTLAAENGDQISQLLLGDIFMNFLNFQDYEKSLEYIKPLVKSDNFYGKSLYIAFCIRKQSQDEIQYIKRAFKNEKRVPVFNHPFYNVKGKHILPNLLAQFFYDLYNSSISETIFYLNLGFFFLKFKSDDNDFKNGIHYLTIAACHYTYDLKSFLNELKYDEQNIPIVLINITKSFINLVNFDITTARNYLGYIYDNSYLITSDVNLSIYYYQLSAGLKSINAEYLLAEIYSNHKKGHKDIKKALHYYNLVLKDDHPLYDDVHTHVFYLDMFSIIRIDEPNNIFASANQCKLMAYNDLGKIYYKGKDVHKDINKSLEYFLLAAKRNFSYSQYHLGKIFYKDKDLMDSQKAIYYFKLAAAQGNVKSQKYLGIIYYEGKIIDQNIKLAREYFSYASSHSDSTSLFYLGFMSYEGKYILQNNEDAHKYFYNSINKNDNQYALNNLGIMCKHGEIKKANIIDATHYFEKAIKKKDDVARFNLAHMYFYGEGVKIDFDRSMELIVQKTDKKIPCYLCLLYLMFMTKFKSIPKIAEIEKEIYNHNNDSETSKVIARKLYHMNSKININLNLLYENLKKYELIYIDHYGNTITRELLEENWKKYGKEKSNNLIKEINHIFFEGLGEIQDL